jgi:hypothetical protein
VTNPDELRTDLYDWAAETGAFSPGKPKHSGPDLIGGFTTAAQEHGHFTDGLRD